MDKILILGVSGFIGSNLALNFLKNGNIVYGIDNFSNSNVSSIYQLLKFDNFIFLEQDARKEISFTTDLVFNCCFNNNFADFTQERFDFVIENIEIIKNILNYCKISGARPFFFSSLNEKDEMFKNASNTIQDLILEYSKVNKIPSKIIRICDCFGENLAKDSSLFISKILNSCFEKKEIIIEQDEQIYFAFVNDVIKALLFLVFNYVEEDIVDISSDKMYLKSDIARFIIGISGNNAKLKIISDTILKPINNPKFIYEDFKCKSAIMYCLKTTVDDYKLMHFS